MKLKDSDETKVRVVSTENPKMKAWQGRLDELEEFKKNGQISYRQYQKRKRKIENEKPLSAKAKRVLSVIGIILIGFILLSLVTNPSNSVKDYSNQDAKVAYDELISEGCSVKFIFDRNNNGGFSDGDFQDFILTDLNDYDNSLAKQYPGEDMGDANDTIWIVTKQQVNYGKSVELYVEYSSVLGQEAKQSTLEDSLESRLSIVSAMTACDQYGKRNYQNFKLHGITGKITEYASDENTWFLKYYVDANGYENKNMECYVNGTTSNPTVSKFLVY